MALNCPEAGIQGARSWGDCLEEMKAQTGHVDLRLPKGLAASQTH